MLRQLNGPRASRRMPIYAFASIDYQHREFDSYFPALVGVKRHDDLISPGAGIACRLAPRAEARLAYSFTHNGSTSDINRYEAHGGIGSTFTTRF
jgi:hypothetical protein